MKNGNIINSFKNAISGIVLSITKEKNMIVHFVIMLIIIILGLYYEIRIYEWLTCIILFSLVIGSELINTSIENTVDLCSPEINQLAKIAKDTAAGAVLVFSFASVVCGIIIFIPYIF